MKNTLLLFLSVLIVSCSTSGQQGEGAPAATQGKVAVAEDTIAAGLTKRFKDNIAREMPKRVNAIFQDSKNHFWFASNDLGVFWYDGKTILHFSTDDGLCDNQIFTIQEDHQGRIWFNTPRGISCFSDNRFTTFPDKSRVNFANSVGVENCWFGMGGGGYQFDGQAFNYHLLPNPPSSPNVVNTTDPENPKAIQVDEYTVYCTFIDADKNTWFGTQSLGVCKYDGKNYTWYQDEGLKGPAVRAIFQDSKGHMWFGNNGSGLMHFDGKKMTNFTREKGLTNEDFVKTSKGKEGTIARVWSINEDNLGNIWIATYDSGVWRYDGENLTNFTTKDGLPSNAVNTIYRSKSGELFFGTDGDGICKYNGEKMIKL